MRLTKSLGIKIIASVMLLVVLLSSSNARQYSDCSVYGNCHEDIAIPIGGSGNVTINNYYSSSNLTFQNTCKSGQVPYFNSTSIIGCMDKTVYRNNKLIINNDIWLKNDTNLFYDNVELLRFGYDYGGPLVNYSLRWVNCDVGMCRVELYNDGQSTSFYSDNMATNQLSEVHSIFAKDPLLPINITGGIRGRALDYSPAYYPFEVDVDYVIASNGTIGQLYLNQSNIFNENGSVWNYGTSSSSTNIVFQNGCSVNQLMVYYNSTFIGCIGESYYDTTSPLIRIGNQSIDVELYNVNYYGDIIGNGGNIQTSGGNVSARYYIGNGSTLLDVLTVKNSTFLYNMTTPFTNWLSTFLYNYNQTTPFATWLSSFVYNYNQTTPAITVANTKALAGNCSAGQYAQNITVNGVQCAPVTASGDGSYNASYPVMQVRYQKRDINSINITADANIPFNYTDLWFNVQANKNYSLLCFLEYTSAAATTGLALNVSTNFTNSQVQLAYDTWSSATAKVGFSQTAFGGALIGTGSGAGVIYKSFLDVDFNAHQAGNLTIAIKSEVQGSVATLKRGSLCELMDVTGAMN